MGPPPVLLGGSTRGGTSGKVSIMADPAAKLESRGIPDDQHLPDDVIALDEKGNEGIVLPPHMREWFDEMIAETDENMRAGRFVSGDEIRAKLRRSA
jgi:hypothetical protein